MSFLDQSSIQSAQLAASRAARQNDILQRSQQRLDRCEADYHAALQEFWGWQTAQEVRDFAAMFSPETLTGMFTAHAQMGAYLTQWNPRHQQPRFPFEYSFDAATGTLTVGRRIGPDGKPIEEA